jgi:hypothetical protein
VMKITNIKSFHVNTFLHHLTILLVLFCRTLPSLAKAKRKMRRPRWKCQRTRPKQEGAVDVGNAGAGRVCHAFEDAGDGRGVERGGDENGGAREGKLADVRQRCRKRQYVSRRRVEKRRWCEEIDMTTSRCERRGAVEDGGERWLCNGW